MKDVVKAIICAFEKTNMNGNVFNVGTGQGTSLLQVIEALKEVTSKNIQVNFEKARSGDIKFSYCDDQKLKNIGFSCDYSFDKGLKEYIEYES